MPNHIKMVVQKMGIVKVYEHYEGFNCSFISYVDENGNKCRPPGTHVEWEEFLGVSCENG